MQYPKLVYKCHSPIRQIYGYAIGVYSEEAKTAPNASNVLENMLDFISNEDLKQLGLNTVGRFDKIKGQVINFPYCNICIHCRARQNNFYLLEKLNGQRGRVSKSLGSAMFLKDEGYGEWLFNS